MSECQYCLGKDEEIKKLQDKEKQWDSMQRHEKSRVKHWKGQINTLVSAFRELPCECGMTLSEGDSTCIRCYTLEDFKGTD